MKYLIADIEADGVRSEERLPEGFEAPRSTPTPAPTTQPTP